MFFFENQDWRAIWREVSWVGAVLCFLPAVCLAGSSPQIRRGAPGALHVLLEDRLWVPGAGDPGGSHFRMASDQWMFAVHQDSKPEPKTAVH